MTLYTLINLLGNSYERVVFNKSLYSQVFFKGFNHFLGTTNFRKKSFWLTGSDHIQSMQGSLSETLFCQFNYPWCSSKKKLREK